MTATAEAEDRTESIYDLTPGQKPAEMPEKASQKQLFIRRAIEDRMEQKRLESMADENYWDNL